MSVLIADGEEAVEAGAKLDVLLKGRTADSIRENILLYETKQPGTLHHSDWASGLGKDRVLSRNAVLISQ
jgi:hypothetical protein